MPNGARPAHLLGAAAIAVAVGNRGAHHLWSVIPAVPRCTPVVAALQLQTSILASTSCSIPKSTPVLAAHQLQTSILASTSCSIPKCTPVLAAPQFQITIPASTGRLVPKCTPVLPAHHLQTSILASTSRSVPRCTPVAADQLRTSIPASTIRSVPRFTPVLAAHQLQTSIPASTSCLVRRCTPAPAATHPKTAIPADTPHKCIEVQLAPIGLIVVSTARNRGPRCRHHNCFAADREARRQDRFYQSGDEFEDGVAHRQNPSHRHLSKEACLPRRFPSPWSVEEPDPKLDRRCFIVRHANGHALAYVYFEEERGRRAAAGPPIAALGIRKRLWAHAAGWDRRRVWAPQRHDTVHR